MHALALHTASVGMRTLSSSTPLCPNAPPPPPPPPQGLVEKLSIIPRSGGALGFTYIPPLTEDRCVDEQGGGAKGQNWGLGGAGRGGGLPAFLH